MPLYESVFIARQDVSATQVETLTEELGKLLDENGGSLHRREYWGLRNLAYRIKKNKKGHYMQIHIDAPAPAVAEMDRVIRLNEDVLRHLTLRIEAFDENPSPILQAKGDRDRGRRRDRDDRSRDDRSRDGRRRDGEKKSAEETTKPDAAATATPKQTAKAFAAETPGEGDGK